MKAAFEEILDKHPLILVLIFGILLLALLKWLSQPIQIIYDPNAPPGL